MDHDRHSTVPVFFSYSESDQTINPTTAVNFVHDHFPAFDPKTDQVVFPRSEKVPHQITLKMWNPELNKLLDHIVDFVSRPR